MPRTGLNRYPHGLKCVHNVLRRSLKQLIFHVDTIHESDLPDYKGYLSAFLCFLYEHHKHEEQIGFPALKKGCIYMDECEEEHAEINAIAHQLEPVAKSSSTFDRIRCKALLLQLQDVMIPHLDAEEEVETSNELRAAGLTNQDMIQVVQDVRSAAMKADASIVLPMMYYHLDQQERVSFWKMEFPWIVRKVLFPCVFSRKHKSYWRFAAYPETGCNCCL